jgi:hypothetical protein
MVATTIPNTNPAYLEANKFAVKLCPIYASMTVNAIAGPVDEEYLKLLTAAL